ncbi:MAG: excinuclease ABC subunit UvrC [Clostridia bacterium]|nr:excinuclease ABC subunit UvrC [Clostridia bacterium]
MTKEQLLEKARLLPPTPGVYIMRNTAGKVIYVGKSKALCNRVSSYFAQTHTGKTARMVASVHDFEVYHTATELEALLLENSFIKQYMPRYNIKLKDSSGYPYLKITDEEYPRLTTVYKREDDRSRYFGPFSSYVAARNIADTARRTFGIPTCNRVFPRDIGKSRPCLNAQIGLCVAPCSGKVTAQEYKEVFANASRFLGGEYTFLIKELTEKMNTAAEDMYYERAAKYRDQINAVKKLGDKQHIVGAPDFDGDFIGVYRDDLGSAVNLFFVRHGAVADRECLYFGADEILDSGTLVSLLQRLYTLRGYIPADIYTAFEVEKEDIDLFEAWAKDFTGLKTVFHVTRRGDKKILAEMASTNAKELLLHKRKSEEKDVGVLANLASFLCLETVPERIEAYDISNSGEEYTTAGMTVVIKGRFAKKQYRTFNIREHAQNDYGATEEALSRRFSHTEWELPDLILMDGGVQHVAVAKRVLAEKGLSYIPVFGMIKDEHHKTRSLTDGVNEIGLTTRQDLFVFIYRIQEEVHRFSLDRMDKKRRKSVSTSSLTAIKGVGEKTAAAILGHFGSFKAVKQATKEELLKVKGLSEKTADSIISYFEGDKK